MVKFCFSIFFVSKLNATLTSNVVSFSFLLVIFNCENKKMEFIDYKCIYTLKKLAHFHSEETKGEKKLWKLEGSHDQMHLGGCACWYEQDHICLFFFFFLGIYKKMQLGYYIRKCSLCILVLNFQFARLLSHHDLHSPPGRQAV